jgi:dTDP-4-amino-4,6-dideoxygalactose transaminase
MADRLPIIDLKRSYAAIKEEINEAILRVLDSQSFILGREVETFEEHVESYLEKGIAIGCASGTDALTLAFMALDLEPGDEVVTTPYSFFATASCVTRFGAVPVFADIDPKTYNIDLDKAASKIGDKTKAFLPVHLFGQMAPLEKISGLCRERGVAIVEDAAQAFGSWRRLRSSNGADAIARAGVMGDIGCYSFFPTKNLGACGDAGMVVARDAKIGERIKKLRVHGAGTMYYHDELGLNSRLDAIQAAILDVKFRHLEEWNEERRVIADRYRMFFAMKNLGELVTLPTELEDNFHIYHQYVIRVAKRDELMQRLEKLGLSTRVYYPLPLHLQKCFAFLGCGPGDFPESENLARDSLALPIFNGLLAEEQERLVDAIADFFLKKTL